MNKRMLTTVTAVIVLLGILCTAVFLNFSHYLLDWTGIADRLAAEAMRVLGQGVVFDKVTVSPLGKVMLHNVLIVGIQGQALLSADQVEVQVNPVSLTGMLMVDHIALRNARMVFEHDEQGKFNWTRQPAPPEVRTTSPEMALFQAPKELPFQHIPVELEQVTAIYRCVRHGIDVTAQLTSQPDKTILQWGYPEQDPHRAADDNAKVGVSLEGFQLQITGLQGTTKRWADGALALNTTLARWQEEGTDSLHEKILVALIDELPDAQRPKHFLTFSSSKISAATRKNSLIATIRASDLDVAWDIGLMGTTLQQQPALTGEIAIMGDLFTDEIRQIGEFSQFNALDLTIPEHITQSLFPIHLKHAVEIRSISGTCRWDSLQHRIDFPAMMLEMDNGQLEAAATVLLHPTPRIYSGRFDFTGIDLTPLILGKNDWNIPSLLDGTIIVTPPASAYPDSDPLIQGLVSLYNDQSQNLPVLDGLLSQMFPDTPLHEIPYSCLIEFEYQHDRYTLERTRLHLAGLIVSGSGTIHTDQSIDWAGEIEIERDLLVLQPEAIQPILRSLQDSSAIPVSITGTLAAPIITLTVPAGTTFHIYDELLRTIPLEE